MADPFATYVALESRWRPLVPEEKVKADTLLADASRIVRRRFTDVDARITAGSLDAEDAEMVVCAMAKRAMLSEGREGTTQTAETAGPFSYSTAYANPTGDLYLTREEKRVLGGVRGGAFVVDTGPSAIRQPWPAGWY